MLWEIISSIAAALSVIVAVVTHLADRHNKKKADTVHAIDHILDSYHDYVAGKDPKKDYRDYVKFLSIVERLATDANEGLLLKKIIKNRLSYFLVAEYERNMTEIIAQRRKQFKRENYYGQIDALIKYLKP